uniref:Kinesin family member 20B n=1 Tax=Amazona collaria TaxID=241587 RepID=A0A8B9F3T2_9PSIT
KRSSLESKGHIQVCLRIRPFTLLERENEFQDCVSLEDSTSIILKAPKNSLIQLSEKNAGQMMQKFTFSRVFGPETSQEEFFEGAMRQPVQDFLDGYNRLVFTYGVTNAGKTYTFQGTEDDVGILPRTMDVLFKSIQGKLYTSMDLKPHRCKDYIKLTKDQVREEIAIKNSILLCTCLSSSMLPYLEELLKDSEQSSPSVKNYVKFSVWVSFFEIYNECFYDLLIPVSNDKKRRTLRLAQDIKGCSYVKGLQWVQISDSKEAFRLLKLGLKQQSIASTKLNAYSSRSHSIFTVKVLKIEDSGAPQVIRVNELSLCDLAGSERCTKTRNEGDRLKESGNINTSLLILGKCINALKNCQQSKLQQHIPFRESKLTHYFQGFFSGKGKIYMIVNISQCASAYDETLNVLKFSAIAQKVFVMDGSILPQVQSFGQKSAKESSLLDTKMLIPRKRTTILWDRSLEDVIEDDDEEQHMSREEAAQKHEANQVCIGKEDYMVCAKAMMNLIEDLKKKFIAEKNNKLLLELKIREEVAQEFTQFFAKRERDFKECLSQERERLEENSERRLEIFKELVNGYTKSTDEGNKDRPSSTYTDLEGVIASLQDDIADIKKQAEAAHKYIGNLEDPQKNIAWLEKELGKATAELTKTKEELTRKTKELVKAEGELANKSKGELVVTVIQFKDCEDTVLEVGRKRCFENRPTVEEEPPTKKGTISSISQEGEQKRAECVKTNTSENLAELLALRERTETLEGQLASLEEKNKKEFSEQIADLHLKLSASEERASGLNEELQQCQADYQEIASELDKQKAINREQEEKIIQLNNEVESTKQNLIDKLSQIKTVLSKVDELYKCHSLAESYAMDIDLVNLKASLDFQKDEPERAKVSSVCMQCQTASTEDQRWEGSFHSSVESIWEECKNIIKVSSQKSQQIQELLQQVEGLKKGLDDSENRNNQLKIKLNEITNQDHQSLKEKQLMSQLEEQIQRKTQDFEKQAAEDCRVIAQFEEEVATYKIKIRELECLLEAFKAKDDSIEKLEVVLKEKESIILNLETNTLALEEKCANSDLTIKELNDKEVNLTEEIVELTSSLENMKRCLQEKEKNENEQIQSIELLRKDLSESSALVRSLKEDLQRKKEDYTDLKEKFSDAKKQIQQVQEEVGTMRSEEKSLRNKVNELQKIKNQLSEELEIKQRTILQLKKVVILVDLCAKEKIIEDMRMTLEEQEQTQMEQEVVIEDKLEEMNRLVLGNLWKGSREENEAKYQTDRKKWLEEKMTLIHQIKEAEILRNTEMRKFEEERKHHVKQQAEIERLAAAQLVEKDNSLQKWREERDKLVEALEVQLKTLASNSTQKDKEIAELKQAALKDLGKVLSLLIVLDSSEVSTENGRTSRFPKPEMEIQFTPLQPSKMEVKHQGSTIPVTVKMLKPRKKRKSEEMDEDFVKSENKKNVKPAMTNSPSTSNKKMQCCCISVQMSTIQLRKPYALRKQESTSSKNSAKKKDGTLQKIGDFFQSSPAIIQSKAKKLIATISSPNSAGPESVKENELKPKRAKRKLYSADISCPLDIPASSVMHEFVSEGMQSNPFNIISFRSL